jgi:hypothetical protein
MDDRVMGAGDRPLRTRVLILAGLVAGVVVVASMAVYSGLREDGADTHDSAISVRDCPDRIGNQWRSSAPGPNVRPRQSARVALCIYGSATPRPDA